MVVKTITIMKRKSKKYKCTESGCDEMFDDMKDWVKHIDNEHKLEEYSCTICGHKTKSKDKYEKHMMAHEEKKISGNALCVVKRSLSNATCNSMN